jgi:UDP-N-acetylmuramyl pentapeptide phosphotransferase/UDP-N-acetylglucosamine-1-phosphate transferase
MSALAAMTAFVVALAMAGLVMRAGILDRPNARSSHARPTPRGGGLGTVAGLFAGLVLLPPAAPADAAALAGIAACAGAAAMLGLLDDLLTLSERLKFLALLLISLAVALTAGPVTELWLPLHWSLAVLGSVLWIFTIVNAVNFMDGSDGLLAATLIPASLALAVVGGAGVAPAGLVLAAALAGFAVWNLPFPGARGRLFCGDAGSLGIAVVWAGLALHWAATGETGTVFLAPLLVMPLLGDVLLTMAVRVAAGHSAFVAHRAHAYQLMIRMGASHGAVALVWGGMSLACGALALVGAAGPAALKLAMLVLGAAGFTLFHAAVRRRAAAAGLDTLQ